MRLALLIVLLFASTAARADPVTAAVAWAAATFAVTTATVYLVATTALLAIGTAVYGTAQARRAARDARDQRNAGMQDRMVNKIGSESPHRYIFGRAKVGGNLVAMFSSGEKDEFKHIVVLLAAHECDAVEEVYINNVAIGLSARTTSGDVTTGRYAPIPGTELTQEEFTGTTFTLSKMPVGVVQVFTMNGIHMTQVACSVSGRTVTIGSSAHVIVNYQYAVGRKFGESVDATLTVASAPYVRVQVHLGGPTDPADAYLMSVVPDKWKSTSVLRGFCYLVVTLDLNNPEFQGGQVPIHALVRGAKLYDPRTGLTTWSQNPALAVWYYLTSPMCGVPVADLPVAQYITAANVCADASSVAGGLYTINGTVTSDQDQAGVLEAMAQCMAGGIAATTWDIYAGKYVAPVLALTQSDIIGGLSITPSASDADTYNGVKGRFISPENDYVLTDFTPYQNPTYLAEDGVDQFTDIPLPFTDTLQRVHNLARIFTEDRRNSYTMKAEFNLKAWPLKFGQRVTFTSPLLGQTAKVFRVTDKGYTHNSPVELTLKEDDPSIWDLADAVVADSTPNTDLPDPWAIAPLASLTCSSGVATLLRQADGSIVPRILVAWPVATTASVFTNGQIELEWRAISTDTWQKTIVSGSDTEAYLSPITPGYFHAVRARTVNPYLNTRSNWTMVTYKVDVSIAYATAYKWATSRPAAPAGAAAYTWGTGSFGAAPASWSLVKPAAPPTGSSALWEATVPVSDIDITGSTAFDWSAAAVSSIGYTSDAEEALAAAAAAQLTADAANAKTDAIVADGVLDRGEKIGLISDLAADAAKYTQLVAMASSLGVSSSAYTAARDARTAYLLSLDDAGQPAWDDITQNTTIVRATYRTKFTDYQREEMALLNGIAARSATTANMDGSIRTPIGGTYAGVGIVSGAIKVKLPAWWTSTMMKFTVDIFEYAAGLSCTLDIAGYNFDGDGGAYGWINVSAKVVGGSNVEYPVYFGHDGSFCCVWIGSSTESWNHPQVRVRDWMGAYENFSRAQWESGWAVTLDSGGAQNVTAQVLDTYPAADWTKVVGTGKPANNATSGAPAGTFVNGVRVEDLTSQAAAGAGAATAVAPLVATFSAYAGVDYSGGQANGNRIIATRTASVTGGTGPFSFLWETLNATSVIARSGVASVSIRASGFDEVVDDVVRLTVMDQGTGRTAVDEMTVHVVFGTPT